MGDTAASTKTSAARQTWSLPLNGSIGNRSDECRAWEQANEELRMARGGRKRGFVSAIGLAFCRDQAILTNMPLLNLRTRPSAANDNDPQVASESGSLAFWWPLLVAWALPPALAFAGLLGSAVLWVRWRM